jgi:hypothetical protein
MLWVRIPHEWGVLDTTLRDKVCQWPVAVRWFDIVEIVVLKCEQYVSKQRNENDRSMFIHSFRQITASRIHSHIPISKNIVWLYPATTQTFHHIYPKGLGIMTLTATFNNISTISNHRTATGHWQTLSRNVISSTPHSWGIRTHNISGHMNFS